MTAALPALHSSAPDAEVDLRFLEHMAEQSRRVAVAVFCLLAVMAITAAARIPSWVAAAWFCLAVSVMLVRRWWLLRLPQRTDLPLQHRIRITAATRIPPWVAASWFCLAVSVMLVRRWWLLRLPQRTDLPLQDRIRIAAVLSFASGTAHGLSLGAFPFLGEIERAFFSVLLLGLCTGAVGTTNGRRNVFLAYAIPAVLPLPVLWAWSPGSPQRGMIELSLALLIALHFWLLVGLARNAWKTFEESVRIRFQERDLNAQLQVALARANEANQAKTRFLAAASHDLRQPLHTIGLLVAALSLRPADGRDKEIIDLLSQVTLALSEQLDQLLDISRLDAGVIPVEHRLVDLRELLRQHHAEMRGAIEEKGLQAILRCEPSLQVFTDPALLSRILRNLTENAVKFTDRGFVAIELAADDRTARISISDSGCGIVQEEQQRVFEEFYQVGNPERDRARGLGLGLSIVHRLAQLLRIELAMTSQPGSGTRFELALPLSFAPSPSAQPCGLPSVRGRLNARVLVLDDERSVRQGVRILLEELGCVCSEASSTEEALQCVAVARPDILLADMRLRAGDSGIAAVRAIRAAMGPVPALLVSGDTAPNRLQEASRAGIRLLHKPVSMDTLRSAIEEALQRGPA